MRDDGSLVRDVETDQLLAGCATCGVSATVAESYVCTTLPASVDPWWCDGASGSGGATKRGVRSHRGPRTIPAVKRSKLTTRAIAWAVDAVRHDDTTVSAIARHLEVGLLELRRDLAEGVN
jgi:transposase